MTKVAFCYLQGLWIVPISWRLAVSYLQRALTLVPNEATGAHGLLAYCFRHAHGVGGDLDRVAHLCFTGIGLTPPDYSCFVELDHLADLYHSADGHPSWAPVAAILDGMNEWALGELEKCASAGDVCAMWQCARWYVVRTKRMQRVPNMTYATYETQAATLGIADAQLALATNQGTNKQRLKWILAAMHQEHPIAFRFMAECYKTGAYGLPQSEDESIRFRRLCLTLLLGPSRC